MSGLRERLGRLKGTSAAQPVPPPAPEAGGEWAPLGAHIHTSPAGSFVMRRRVYGADSVHGYYRLRELADVAPQLSAFHDRDAVVRHEALLFFDTETTGLGVGAGNVPFMVGIGYYTGEQLTVEQLLIRNPAEEHAMLVYVQELLPRFTHVVSYNGRTFDWPILKNRYVLNRLQLNDDQLLQLDLLYASRSLWRNSLPSCRLSKVEESRLGFDRVDDVPGSLAPTLYFQYLAEKDPKVLSGVFVHNEHDLVTLAALSIHFGKLLEGSESDGVAAGEDLNLDLDLEEHFRTGSWLEKMERGERAALYFNSLHERLLQKGTDEQLAEGDMSTLLQLAQTFKKRGDYTRAVALWNHAIRLQQGSMTEELEAYVELAMHYEHREKQIGIALEYAEAAWSRLRRRQLLRRQDRKEEERERAWEKRIDRLNEKMKRPSSAKSMKPTAQYGQEATATQALRKKRTPKPIYASEGLI
ncbi:ribonuclease H-like domain-containing protein [Paenibacillus whitsoniae]|uniref:YprB ribonuclease H-like domain-containing protein n=1 Tax=Paenibacillus whitsoniae TaxID=2496558 RepID=A0A3S0I7N2_9BACL|nr:ribonuclease H-like domain-containing protein [Paenibacillus whitsoniae]RTE05407.1 hypothetical protein EJQ19_25475 [Paenibacillus whitsoniae]